MSGATTGRFHTYSFSFLYYVISITPFSQILFLMTRADEARATARFRSAGQSRRSARRASRGNTCRRRRTLARDKVSTDVNASRSLPAFAIHPGCLVLGIEGHS